MRTNVLAPNGESRKIRRLIKASMKQLVSLLNSTAYKQEQQAKEEREPG